jgi:sterol desaturase/sphingolipid hydroxylase (fatty acid hydroxylase superfamily)
MITLNPHLSFWFHWFIFCGIIMGGYFALAFSIYHLIYSVFNQTFKAHRLPVEPQDKMAIADDIKLSVLSGVLFALGAACFMFYYQRGYTQIYTEWHFSDLSYIILSYFTVLLLQDTFFYFTHRLSHQRFFYKWTHQGHHQSHPPTPWTFFALEPMEAIGQAVFLLGITLVIPLHIGVLIAVLLTMSTWAMGNHLGFPIVPDSFISRYLGRWFIGSAHHLIHHQKLNRHYGLYFTFWDKLLGTQDPEYEAKRMSGSL